MSDTSTRATRKCSQCGAAVEAAAHLLATKCAFCDSPLVDAAPPEEPIDSVVPFEVDRSQAGRRLSAHLQSHWLLPDELKYATRPEELRALMIPFYHFDALVRSEYSCDVGVYWYRTEHYTTTENGRRVNKTRQVRETEWFPVEGSHIFNWTNHLVSASVGLPEGEANALEPFDLGKALPFSPELTAGFEAEFPTVPHQEARDTAMAELPEREKEQIASKHLPGNTSRSMEVTCDIDIESMGLALLPVWVAAYHGPDDGLVRLLVNGQTGEVIGYVPRSQRKVKMLILGIAGVAAFLFFSFACCSMCFSCLGNL